MSGKTTIVQQLVAEHPYAFYFFEIFDDSRGRSTLLWWFCEAIGLPLKFLDLESTEIIPYTKNILKNAMILIKNPTEVTKLTLIITRDQIVRCRGLVTYW